MAQRDAYDYRTEIGTIGQAAAFIATLPTRYDGLLHWSLAGSAISAVHYHPEDGDLFETATLALENALATEGMLVLSATTTR